MIIEYDFPLFNGCDQCFGVGYMSIWDPTIIGLDKTGHRVQVTCKSCDGMGGTDLEELELEGND